MKGDGTELPPASSCESDCTAIGLSALATHAGLSEEDAVQPATIARAGWHRCGHETWIPVGIWVTSGRILQARWYNSRKVVARVVRGCDPLLQTTCLLCSSNPC